MEKLRLGQRPLKWASEGMSEGSEWCPHGRGREGAAGRAMGRVSTGAITGAAGAGQFGGVTTKGSIMGSMSPLYRHAGAGY